MTTVLDFSIVAAIDFFGSSKLAAEIEEFNYFIRAPSMLKVYLATYDSSSNNHLAVWTISPRSRLPKLLD